MKKRRRNLPDQDLSLLLAQITILKKRNERLTRQLLIPWGTVITAFLPYLANLIMTPGGFIHSWYISLLSKVAPDSLQTDLFTGEGMSTALQVPDSSHSSLTSHNSSLTAHKRLAIELLTQFHESFVKKLQSWRMITAIGGIGTTLNPQQLFKMEAEILETKKLSLPSVNIAVPLSETDRIGAKEKFISLIYELNVHSKFPVIKEIPQYSVSSTRGGENSINKHFSVQPSAELLEKNFYQLADILSRSYYNLIDEVNKGDLLSLSQLSIFELMVSQETTSWHLILISILASFLANNLIIYPVLKSIYRKSDGSREVKQLTTGYLSERKAQQAIELLTKRNRQMEIRIPIIYKIFAVILPLLALLLAIYDYRKFDRISPTLFVTGLCGFGASIYDGYEMIMTCREKNAFQRKIKAIQDILNLAVKCTGQKWTIKEGRWLSDCYFTYDASFYKKFLRAGTVNTVVRDILARNGLGILSSGTSRHHVSPPEFLKDSKAMAINQQIKNYLDRLLSIRQLKQQIQSYFSRSDIYEVRKMDTQNLPVGEFAIDHSQIIDFDIKKIQPLFPQCQLEDKNSYLLISGSMPGDDPSLFGEVKPNYQRKKPVNKKEHKEESTHFEKKEEPSNPKAKRQSKLPDFKRQIDDDFGPEEVFIKWSSQLIYDNQRVGDIKPIDHPIYGRNHFILFDIPNNIPGLDPDRRKLYKEKIESGHLAKNEKNAQGLQFRTGQAIDQTTVSGNRTFIYHLRFKMLGMGGNTRLYAETLTTHSQGQEKFLHKFSSINFHSH